MFLEEFSCNMASDITAAMLLRSQSTWFISRHVRCSLGFSSTGHSCSGFWSRATSVDFRLANSWVYGLAAIPLA